MLPTTYTLYMYLKVCQLTANCKENERSKFYFIKKVQASTVDHAGS